MCTNEDTRSNASSKRVKQTRKPVKISKQFSQSSFRRIEIRNFTSSHSRYGRWTNDRLPSPLLCIRPRVAFDQNSMRLLGVNFSTRVGHNILPLSLEEAEKRTFEEATLLYESYLLWFEYTCASRVPFYIKSSAFNTIHATIRQINTLLYAGDVRARSFYNVLFEFNQTKERRTEAGVFTYSREFAQCHRIKYEKCTWKR